MSPQLHISILFNILDIYLDVHADFAKGIIPQTHTALGVYKSVRDETRRIFGSIELDFKSITPCKVSFHVFSIIKLVFDSQTYD